MINQSVTVGSNFDSSEVMKLVQKATEFKSHISLVLNEKTANAKSIMGIISLNLKTGTDISIMANGEDEEHVVPALRHLIGA